jgi:hypothetical protein
MPKVTVDIQLQVSVFVIRPRDSKGTRAIRNKVRARMFNLTLYILDESGQLIYNVVVEPQCLLHLRLFQTRKVAHPLISQL